MHNMDRSWMVGVAPGLWIGGNRAQLIVDGLTPAQQKTAEVIDLPPDGELAIHMEASARTGFGRWWAKHVFSLDRWAVQVNAKGGSFMGTSARTRRGAIRIAKEFLAERAARRK